METETIQHFLDSGDETSAHCWDCNHHGPVDMEALKARLGPDHGCLHQDIAKYLKCSKCGSKRIGLIRSPKGNTARVPNYGG